MDMLNYGTKEMEKELVVYKCMLHMPKKLMKVLLKKNSLHIVQNH